MSELDPMMPIHAGESIWAKGPRVLFVALGVTAALAAANQGNTAVAQEPKECPPIGTKDENGNPIDFSGSGCTSYATPEPTATPAYSPEATPQATPTPGSEQNANPTLLDFFNSIWEEERVFAANNGLKFEGGDKDYLAEKYQEGAQATNFDDIVGARIKASRRKPRQISFRLTQIDNLWDITVSESRDPATQSITRRRHFNVKAAALNKQRVTVTPYIRKDGKKIKAGPATAMKNWDTAGSPDLVTEGPPPTELQYHTTPYQKAKTYHSAWNAIKKGRLYLGFAQSCKSAQSDLVNNCKKVRRALYRVKPGATTYPGLHPKKGDIILKKDR